MLRPRVLYLLFLMLGVGASKAMAQSTDSIVPVKYNHANGRVSSEGQLLNGKPHGYWKNYYESGILRSEGARSNDRLSGPWKFYDPEGRLQSVINYAGGKKQGPKESYHENGKLRLLEHYTGDIKDSTETTYDANGKLIKRTPFVGGKEQGTGFDYAPDDGRVVGMSIYQNGYRKYTEGFNRKDRQGNRQGMWKEFDDSARIVLETPFRNNLRHGYQKRYDRSGSVTETRKFVDDIEIPEPQELAKLDIKRQYHPNAQLKQIGSYKKGKPEGVHRFYEMDGKLVSSKVYVDGQVIGEGIVDEAGLRQGEWKHYYPSGQEQSQGRYVNGRREGKWKFYYPSGKLEQEGEYSKGKYEGKWLWYHENEQLWRDEEYSDGKEEGPAVEMNAQGDTVAIGTYLDGLRDGDWTVTYGDIKEVGKYVNDNREGKWVHYDLAGKKTFEGNYVDGREDGRHLYYYEGGKVRLEAQYSFGEADGNWLYYDEAGNIRTTISYKAGKEERVDGNRLPELSP